MIRNNIKTLLVLLSALIVLLMTLCYVLYFVPSSISPSKDIGVFGERSPELILSNALPFADLNVGSVLIDGAGSAEFQVNSTGSKQRIKIGKSLVDGRHTVRVSGTIGSVVPLTFTTTRSFTIDTTAPAIELYDYDDLIAVKSSGLKILRGETEPGSNIYISDQMQNPIPFEVDSTGHFKISIKNIVSEVGSADLEISVVDIANNSSKRKLHAVSDTIPPKVEPINFTPSNNYFDPSMSPKVAISDTGSKIKFAVYEINGSKHISSNATSQLSSDSSTLLNGTNRINVISYDIAGNTTRSSYNIELYNMNMIVDISGRTLKYFEGDKLVKTYKVSIGAEGFATPKGQWKIIKKRKNPTWYNPKSEWSKDMPPTIGPGPGNPLGTRALYLNAPEIRIHGTYKTGSVGIARTHGCIRLSMSELEELYEMVPVGTPIRVY